VEKMATPEQQRKPTEWEYRPEEIAATNVSYEDYLAYHAHDFYEWDNERVVKMSPIDKKHDALTLYLAIVFSTYFELKPIGMIRQEPFVMRLAAQKFSAEPDLQIILKTNPNELKPIMVDGPADICIEVIAPKSTAKDRGRKFEVYEAAGVPEYWILDPIRTDSLFHRLNGEGYYIWQMPDADGYYRTPLLPDFALHVPTLWLDKLPTTQAIIQQVKALLAKSA
jgi:Uma2 family endonuclease